MTAADVLQVDMYSEETFGERLRRTRRARGMTQRQLAELVSVDFTYLSKLENNRLPPPADSTITRLSEALTVSPDELFAVARKVPTELRRRVKEAPPETALLLRKLSTSRVTEEQYRRIMEILGDTRSAPPGKDDDNGAEA